MLNIIAFVALITLIYYMIADWSANVRRKPVRDHDYSRNGRIIHDQDN